MSWSETGFLALIAGTLVLAATHTLSPDHWFPFVMVGRARRWKTARVLLLACAAGIGHVGTSVVIGLLGVFAKRGFSRAIAVFLENATPILLVVFGFGYAFYGLYRRRVNAHGHSHGIPLINKWLGIDPHAYVVEHHGHSHDSDHTVEGSGQAHHTHHTENVKGDKAAWGLVAILGLTPCIALLPLTFAAVKYGTSAIVLVNVVFAVTTIGTILLITWLGFKGVSRIKLDYFDKNGDIIAGVIIGLLGVFAIFFEI